MLAAGVLNKLVFFPQSVQSLLRTKQALPARRPKPEQGPGAGPGSEALLPSTCATLAAPLGPSTPTGGALGQRAARGGTNGLANWPTCKTNSSATGGGASGPNPRLPGWPGPELWVRR